MEIILSIVSFLWLITILVVVKTISSATISVHVHHEHENPVVTFDDLYDHEGEVKHEHDDTVDFNEVFKVFNDLMVGEDEVKSNG